MNPLLSELTIRGNPKKQALTIRHISDSPGGFYAVRLANGEMYDLGNIAYIPHFILYDREQSFAVDVSYAIAPGILLSAKHEPILLDDDFVSELESWLTSKKRPPYRPSLGVPNGIPVFHAEELDPGKYASIRAALREFRDARKVLESKIEELTQSATQFGSRYLIPG